AEVASVGGYVQQYQVDVDPNKLRSYGLPLSMVVEAVERSNRNVGGNVVEQAGQWSVVRGVGLIESSADIENIPLTAQNGIPIYVKNVATVKLGMPFCADSGMFSMSALDSIRPTPRTTDHWPACSTTLPPTLRFDRSTASTTIDSGRPYERSLFGSTSTWYCWT